jgi:hypothetical protein
LPARVPAEHQISLPIADSLPRGHDLRAILDAPSEKKVRSDSRHSEALPPSSMPMPQLEIQRPATPSVSLQIPIDRLIAHGRLALLLPPPSDLLRTPAFAQTRQDILFQLTHDLTRTPLVSSQGPPTLLAIVRSIAEIHPPRRASPELAIDRRTMDLEPIGELLNSP